MYFDRVWPLLEPAAEQWGEHNYASVRQAIVSGRAHLWGGDSSAMVTTISNYPTGRRAGIGWLAGGDLDELRDVVIPKATEFGRWNGCHEVRVIGRRGFLRALPGWTELGTVMRREL